jgi:hypothetical protein
LKTTRSPEGLSGMIFRLQFPALWREIHTLHVAKSLKDVHSKKYNFAGFEKMGLRFFITRWVSHELSAELKAKRSEICKEMLQILEELDLQYKNHIITGDECRIYWDDYHYG